MKLKSAVVRVFSLTLSLSIALPSPALALRVLSLPENPTAQGGLEESLSFPSAEGLEESEPGMPAQVARYFAQGCCGGGGIL